jgi:hypothetical protein
MASAQIRFRDDDLYHVNSEVSRCAEQILASTRLPAGCACRYDWGILIEQPESARRWPQCPGRVEYRHLLDETELVSDLGIFAMSNRTIDNVPAGQYISVCAWFHRRAAAQFLWTECLHFCPPDRHATETYLTLKLAERPSNDHRPGFSRTRHGTLLQHFDAPGTQAFLRYFVLEGIRPPIEPTPVSLGGDTYLVFTHSVNPDEPLRAIIVEGQWSRHIAIKELQRWLKSPPRKTEMGGIK